MEVYIQTLMATFIILGGMLVIYKSGAWCWIKRGHYWIKSCYVDHDTCERCQELIHHSELEAEIERILLR